MEVHHTGQGRRGILFIAGWIAYIHALYLLGLFIETHPLPSALEGAGAGLLGYGVGHLDRWFAARAAPRGRIPPWHPPDCDED